MERQVNSNVNGSVMPSKRNSHDDDDIDITEDSGVEIRNAEQPEQQQQQAHEVEDVPSCPVSDSMPPLAASLLSSCSSGNNIDIWEPYPLNPPQSFDEEKLRFEALQAYLDLAIQSNHLEGTEVNANEESTNSANNVNNQDTTESHIASTGDESGNNREMQGESIADILSVDYTKLPRIRDYQVSLPSMLSFGTLHLISDSLCTIHHHHHHNHQEQVWEKHYMDLVEYHQREGHCCVPHLYQENPGLARWVGDMIVACMNKNGCYDLADQATPCFCNR